MIIAATNAFAANVQDPVLKLDTAGILTLIGLPAGTTRVFFAGIFVLDT